jgi:CspA family cold shock protein
MEEERSIGTVKWFSVRKGYGFITRREGKDVFIHYSAIRPGGPRSLHEGDTVEFSIETGPRGPRATDLTVTEFSSGLGGDDTTDAPGPRPRRPMKWS